jgi:hypothetical protein
MDAGDPSWMQRLYLSDRCLSSWFVTYAASCLSSSPVIVACHRHRSLPLVILAENDPAFRGNNLGTRQVLAPWPQTPSGRTPSVLMVGVGEGGRSTPFRPLHRPRLRRDDRTNHSGRSCICGAGGGNGRLGVRLLLQSRSRSRASLDGQPGRLSLHGSFLG